MKFKSTLSLLAILSLGLSAAHAHRAWVLPSTTVLSGDESWVTFDLCASNNIFFPNHRPMPVDSITALAPDGSAIAPQNATEGALRTTFDLELKQEGTYMIGVIRSGLGAFWREGEERKRWRGTKEELISKGITKKPGVRISDGHSAIISYVTLGKPSDTVLKPKGQGIEIVFNDGHPNDLFTNETSKLTVLLNGKPAAGLELTLMPDGDRYRNEAGEIKLKTDDKGSCEIHWSKAGRYWLNAEIEEEGEEIDGVPLRKMYAINLTLEVFPE